VVYSNKGQEAYEEVKGLGYTPDGIKGTRLPKTIVRRATGRRVDYNLDNVLRAYAYITPAINDILCDGYSLLIDGFCFIKTEPRIIDPHGMFPEISITPFKYLINLTKDLKPDDIEDHYKKHKESWKRRMDACRKPSRRKRQEWRRQNPTPSYRRFRYQYYRKRPDKPYGRYLLYRRLCNLGIIKEGENGKKRGSNPTD